MARTDTTDTAAPPLSDDEVNAQLLDAAPPEPPEPISDTPPEKRRSRSGTSRRDRKAKAARTAPATDRPPRPSTTRRAPLAPRIEQLYTMAGLGVSMMPNPVAQATGLAMAQNAEPCAKAWEQLAKENPAVARALERLLTVSAVGSLVAAHLPIVIAALAAGGNLPAALGGAPKPAEPAPPMPSGPIGVVSPIRL